MEDTLVYVMAGGQGERLRPLTDVRAKPAVPFGGIFRIIDFTLSNCLHAGLRRIYVMSGGQVERLRPLTDVRAKPAVPFGGIFRIIDFTLSNCLHAGLRRIY